MPLSDTLFSTKSPVLLLLSLTSHPSVSLSALSNIYIRLKASSYLFFWYWVYPSILFFQSITLSTLNTSFGHSSISSYSTLGFVFPTLCPISFSTLSEKDLFWVYPPIVWFMLDILRVWSISCFDCSWMKRSGFLTFMAKLFWLSRMTP